MFEPPLIVQETDPSRALKPLRGRAAEECDEFAPSHAKLPVGDVAYQRGSGPGTATRQPTDNPIPASRLQRTPLTPSSRDTTYHVPSIQVTAQE
jgi:hypothetical protein